MGLEGIGYVGNVLKDAFCFHPGEGTVGPVGKHPQAHLFLQVEEGPEELLSWHVDA